MNLEQIKQFYRDEVVFDGGMYPSHFQVINFVAGLKPQSILEFGSAWGKNYPLLKQLLPDIQYQGIDISPHHIKIAEKQKINVKLGDEDSLYGISNDSYDVVFTHSVLNHLPIHVVDKIVTQFKRITKHHVVAEECIEIKMDRWFIHNYSKLGYKDTGKKKWSVIIKAYYHLFHLAINAEP